MRRHDATPGRPGMTLIELLIVMAIIGALASLLIGAVFSLRESQMKSFTETLVHKLTSALDQQWKAVLDQVREEEVPGWAMTLANNDQRRARVIYTKLRLRQEFPVTFYQAKYPFATQYGNKGQSYPPVNGGVLPPAPTYQKALANVVMPAPATAAPLPNVPPVADTESSALLYMALRQGRRGMAAFSIDEHIESTAIQTDANGFKYFVDVWGKPLRLFIFPARNSELNESPYVNSVAVTSVANSLDPLDPEGTLYPNPASNWPNANRLVFTNLVHPLGTVPGQPNTASRLTPVIASAGRDSKWGIDLDDAFMTVQTTPPTAVEDTYDNIYSYRLRRSGARGD